ncbi:MAG: PDZ domain-containing protein [Candidatus Aminicenantes bacterium]|nr:PDZ domain-containing protein [Candidatus Aminicenantes bacterium]
MIKKFMSMSMLAAFLFVPFLSLMAEPASSAMDEVKIEEITKKVFPCVVKVIAKNRYTKIAMGVVMDKDGHIVTTALISPRDEKLYVITTKGKKIEAEFLGLDSETQLAVIKAKDKTLTPIVMGEVKDVSPGAWVGLVSISPEDTPQITQGIVSSVSPEKLRLNVWVTRGASGSPILDKDGRMIGLLRGVYTEEGPFIVEFREKEVAASGFAFSRAEAPSSGMALAIPIDIVKSVTVEIKEKGRVQRGWLGVRFYPNEEGDLEIIEVEKESPAEMAKLEEGDIILQIQGKDVTSGEMVVHEIRSMKPGQTIALKILRDGKEQEVQVRLGEYTEEDVWREMEQRFPRLFVPEARKLIEAEPRERLRLAFETRKYIGVDLNPLNTELAEYFGVKEGKGLLVGGVGEDTPAAKAGLKVGDILVKADGKDLAMTSDLSRILQEKEKGDRIKLEFYRDKKKMSVEVEVAEEERSTVRRFSPEDWKEYTETWGKYSDNLMRQQEKWQDETSKEMKSQIERMDREFEEVLKKSKESQERLSKSLKWYKSIRV